MLELEQHNYKLPHAVLILIHCTVWTIDDIRARFGVKPEGGQCYVSD